jgi:hypothetical protein
VPVVSWVVVSEQFRKAEGKLPTVARGRILVVFVGLNKERKKRAAAVQNLKNMPAVLFRYIYFISFCSIYPLTRRDGHGHSSGGWVRGLEEGFRGGVWKEKASGSTWKFGSG